MSKVFQIQLPMSIIRNPDINCVTFYVYAKLIQHYYVHKGKSNMLQIDHKKFMYFSNINSNKTFKKVIDSLYENKLIKNKIEQLPRSGLIEIELNDFFNKEKNYQFAQLPFYLLDKCVLEEIGYEGYRLLYYYKSYINDARQYCFCSRETIARDIGVSDNTVDKYNKILKKWKLVKITKHELKGTGEFEINEFGTEKESFTKYNNHYVLRFDQFESVYNKMKNSSG